MTDKKFPELQGLHHFAWKCRDVEETIDFYEGILELPMVHEIREDYVPSTGQYAPYRHIFFQMKDGSHIAFFELGDNQGIKTDADDWVVHFAFKANNREELLKAKERLELNGIEVIGPTRHGDFIESIYFFDPNGLRLEITYVIK